MHSGTHHSCGRGETQARLWEKIRNRLDGVGFPQADYVWFRAELALRVWGASPRFFTISADRLVSNVLSLPRSHCSTFSAIPRAPRLRSAHSQTIATLQPSSSSRCRLRSSRSMLELNFSSQNSARVVGVVAYGQPSCRCQKQPWTKQTARNRRKTRSGVPGRLRSCRRYRSPRA